MTRSAQKVAVARATLAALAIGSLGLVVAQPPAVQPDEVVPRDVRQIYDRVLQFLADSQSLFQGDVDSWKKWNENLVRKLRKPQQPDGSIRGRFNPTISTSLSLHSLALNYRFLPIYER